VMEPNTIFIPPLESGSEQRSNELFLCPPADRHEAEDLQGMDGDGI
jgi:hypothetical protein